MPLPPPRLRPLFALPMFAVVLASFGLPSQSGALDLESVARRECERLNDAGSYADALPHCRDAADLRRSADARPADGALGRSLTSLGLALEMTGDRRSAEASYREALALHQSVGQHEAVALVLSNLAALAIGGGDYAAALAWLAAEEAVTRRAVAAGDAAWAPAELDYVRMNRSVALEQLGAYSEALAEIRPVADHLLANGHENTARRETAALAVNLAVLYRNLGDPRRALALLERARVAYERLGDRSALANVHLNRGLAYQLNLRAPERAEEELSRALALARESGDRGEELRTLCALGDLRLAGGHLSDARAAFEEAMAAAIASDAAAGRWTAQAGLGRVARDAGDPALALVHLRAAIAGIESTGEALGDAALRGGLLSDQRAVYAAAVDLLAEQALIDGPDAEQAAREGLALAERAKARELLDALAGGGSGAPLSGDELAALAARFEPALAFFFGERHLWRWEARGGRWRVARAGETGEVAELVTQIHRRLARGEAAPAEALARLAALLLPGALPAATELRVVPDGRLFYLPFELLPDPERSGANLTDRFAVSYVPSLSVLAHLRNPTTKARWRVAALADPELPLRLEPGDSHSLAGLLAQRFGLPPLPGAAREAQAAARRLGEPSAVDTGAQATEAKLGQRAREGARVLHIAAHTVADESLAGGVALFLSPEGNRAGAPGALDPEATGAGARAGVGNGDGLVTAAELARLPLEADLAVLSGCRTALAEPSTNGGAGGNGSAGSDASDGRGLASLSGALLGAGARGVVASLWEVGDAATAALMEQFYFELARGNRPAVALQLAKRRMAHDPRWSAAGDWAGFVLLGDPGPVASRWASRAGLAGALAALALAGAILLRRTLYRRRASAV